MTLLRRFFAIQALMLWQGGFLFYAAFVVPTGTEVLGTSFAQGRITRFVTDSLNLVGLAAIAFFAWDLLQAPPKTRRLKRWLWGTWTVLALGLASLFLIHLRLEGLVDFNDETFENHGLFRFWHRTYLWISTIQWLAGLTFAMFLLRSWRIADSSDSLSPGTAPT